MKIVYKNNSDLTRITDLCIGDTFAWSTDPLDTERIFVKAMDQDNTPGYFSLESNTFYKLTNLARDAKVRLVEAIVMVN